jgi:hypothetical protein
MTQKMNSLTRLLGQRQAASCQQTLTAYTTGVFVTPKCPRKQQLHVAAWCLPRGHARFYTFSTLTSGTRASIPTITQYPPVNGGHEQHTQMQKVCDNAGPIAVRDCFFCTVQGSSNSKQKLAQAHEDHPTARRGKRREDDRRAVSDKNRR